MSMVGCYKRITQHDLNKIILDPSFIEDIIYPDDDHYDESFFDIDKAWHGIHYLLNGKVWRGRKPLFNAVLGGTAIGDEIGYGPARYLTIDQVVVLARYLNKISIDKLKKKYNPKKLIKKHIYPDVWDEEEDLEYLIEYYVLLVNFYNKAAENHEAVLLYLS
jgi:hypothetical protein